MNTSDSMMTPQTPPTQPTQNAHDAPPANPKSTGIAYLLWFFLGGFGAHRFYAGRTGSGFGMLGLWVGSFIGSFVLIGLVGFLALFVWWLVDAFLISGWLNEQRDGTGGEVSMTMTDAPEPARAAA